MKLPVAIVLTTCLILANCTNIPKAVRTSIPGPSVQEIQQNPQRHLGRQIRWGGAIVKVNNQAEYTEFEIVSRNLERSGRPADSNKSQGRFIARVAKFLEPTDYKSGRKLTVVGSLRPTITRKIGDHAYTFPVVAVTELHLWEPLAEYPLRPYYRPYPDPWWYDRHPFYPYHPLYGHHYHHY